MLRFLFKFLCYFKNECVFEMQHRRESKGVVDSLSRAWDFHGVQYTNCITKKIKVVVLNNFENLLPLFIYNLDFKCISSVNK